MELITAYEAKQRVKNAESENQNRCKEYVTEKIMNAIGQGEYAVRIDVERGEDVVGPIVEFLESKGYEVDHNTGVQWDPCNFYTISWD